MKAYVNNFKRICGAAPQESMSATEARSLVLYITHGQIPAYKLVGPMGECLSVSEICANAMEDVKRVGSRFSFDFGSHAARIKALKSKEETMNPICSAPADVPYSDEAQDYRRDLLQSRPDSLMGIHFFDWEGRPRTSEGIWQSLCKYSMNKKVAYSRARTNMLIAAVVVGLVLAVYGYKNPEQARAKLNKLAALFEKLGVPKAFEKAKAIFKRADEAANRGEDPQEVINDLTEQSTEIVEEAAAQGGGAPALPIYTV